MALLITGLVLIVCGGCLVAWAEHPPMTAKADLAVTMFGGLLLVSGVLFALLALAIQEGWVS